MDQSMNRVQAGTESGSANPWLNAGIVGCVVFILGQVAWTGFRAAENGYLAAAREVASTSTNVEMCRTGVMALSKDLPPFVQPLSENRVSEICVRASGKMSPEITGPQPKLR